MKIFWNSKRQTFQNFSVCVWKYSYKERDITQEIKQFQFFRFSTLVSYHFDAYHILIKLPYIYIYTDFPGHTHTHTYIYIYIYIYALIHAHKQRCNHDHTHTWGYIILLVLYDRIFWLHGTNSREQSLTLNWLRVKLIGKNIEFKDFFLQNLSALFERTKILKRPSI